MSAGRTPGGGDIEFSDHGSMETTDSVYRGLAIYLDNNGIEDLWKTGDPLTNVITLMHNADDWALHDGSDPYCSYEQQRLYEAAVQLVIDPAIQLEIDADCFSELVLPNHLFVSTSMRLSRLSDGNHTSWFMTRLAMGQQL